MEHKINPAYPSQYETEMVLQDCSKILLRPIRKDDTERWSAFFHRLRSHTKYLPCTAHQKRRGRGRYIIIFRSYRIFDQCSPITTALLPFKPMH